jgi:hypothetical protein
MPHFEMEDQPFRLSRITPEQKSAGSTRWFGVTDLTQETQRSFRLRSSGESCAETQTEHATAKHSGRIFAETILITASPLCPIAHNWLNGRSERRIVRSDQHRTVLGVLSANRNFDEFLPLRT